MRRSAQNLMQGHTGTRCTRQPPAGARTSDPSRTTLTLTAVHNFAAHDSSDSCDTPLQPLCPSASWRRRPNRCSLTNTTVLPLCPAASCAGDRTATSKRCARGAGAVMSVGLPTLANSHSPNAVRLTAHVDVKSLCKGRACSCSHRCTDTAAALTRTATANGCRSCSCQRRMFVAQSYAAGCTQDFRLPGRQCFSETSKLRVHVSVRKALFATAEPGAGCYTR